MNGGQIESLLQLIDENVDLTRQEAADYIRSHRNEIAESLATTGVAVVHTRVGDLPLTIKDLEASAAHR